MRECISISKNLLLLFVLTVVTALASPTLARAEDPPAAEHKEDKTLVPEEDDFSQTPFTEYGEFNEEEEEAADTRFFQFGRFFGVSIGTGFQGVTGNRGTLWQGGIPLVDLHVHYWFDFNVALDMGGYYVAHYYPTSSSARTSVNMFVVGLGVKYYFDTKNLSSAISFASPYLRAGFGSYSKSELSSNGGSVNTDTAVGFNVGGGLEFAIKPKKVYFTVEGQMHFVNFMDTHYTTLGPPDLTGFFYTTTANILFTW